MSPQLRLVAASGTAARHAHSKQDELVYVMEGEFVFVTDEGRSLFVLKFAN